MANRILSIEIGRVITRVVEMDYQMKKPKIYGAFSFETPATMWNDGVLTDSEVFVAKFKQECETSGIDTKKAIFTVSSGRIASREITVPMVKENKLAALIEANASEYFPVDLTEYRLVHTIVEKMDKIDKKDKDATKQYKVNVMAIPKDLLNSYMTLANACQLTIEGFDYVGNSVAQLARKHYSNGGLNVLFKIGFAHTMITILKDDKIEMQRFVPYGIQDAVDTMIESKAYGDFTDYKEALDLFTRKTCIRRRLDESPDYKDEEETDQKIISAKAEITEALRPLLNNLTRNLNYYVTNNHNPQIDQINIIGVGSVFAGISKLFSNEMNHKVTILTTSEESKLAKEMETSGFSLSYYFGNVGAIIDPILKKDDFKGDTAMKTTGEGESLKLAIAIFSVCVVAAVCMILFCVVSGISAKNKQNELQSKIASLQSAQDTYNTYTQTKAQYDELQKLYAETENPNEHLDAFITEMEQKMPSSINVITMSADDAGVNMNITVADKTAAAKVLVELRSFSSLSDVQTTGITEVTDAAGASSVSMALTCIYADGSGTAQTTTSK